MDNFLHLDAESFSMPQGPAGGPRPLAQSYIQINYTILAEDTLAVMNEVQSDFPKFRNDHNVGDFDLEGKIDQGVINYNIITTAKSVTIPYIKQLDEHVQAASTGIDAEVLGPSIATSSSQGSVGVVRPLANSELVYKVEIDGNMLSDKELIFLENIVSDFLERKIDISQEIDEKVGNREVPVMLVRLRDNTELFKIIEKLDNQFNNMLNNVTDKDITASNSTIVANGQQFNFV